ncbi:MAG: hypothetical protein DHS20C19_06460 [Acidimicrobiales bacterium]|nr:MAG: hypothetical protein DHS20C19_06460 [Acidimicrobiales bacterium]
MTTTTTILPEANDTAISDIRLVAIEITQGLQNLENDFPLLHNRETWVRVHAVTDAPGGSQPAVDAAILVIVDGVEMGVRWAENAPVTIPGEMSGDARGTHDGTPYMRIPSDWILGGSILEVRAMVFALGDVDASNEADPDNNAGSVDVFLDEADAATIHYWPLYMETDDGAPLIHTTGMGYLDEHMTAYRTWPIGQLIGVPHPTVVGDADSDWDLTDSPGQSEPNMVLAEMFAESGLDGSHQYAGMVHQDVPSHFAGLASSGTTWSKMGSGFDGGSMSWRNRSGETVAHEGGHWAGLRHAPCKYDPDDPLPQEAHGGAFDATFPASYSWPSCSLAPTDWAGYYGLDPVPWASGNEAPAILSNDPNATNAAYPWMSYMNPGWTDPYHGCALLVFLSVACDNGLVAPTDPSQGGSGTVPSGGSGGVPAFDCALGLPGEDADFCDLQLGPSGDPTAAPPPGQQQLIVGTINWIDGDFSLARAVELTTRGELDGRMHGDPASGGPYVLALVGDEDQVQWATTIDVDNPAAHGATEDAPTSFAVRFPTFDDTARVLLVRPGEVLAELTPSAAPTVELARATVSDGALLVDVSIDDPDGDRHWTSVQYRPDANSPWVALAAGSSRTSFRFDDLGDLPTSDDGEVMVRVTDGFSTTTASRSGVQVADQPPLLTLIAPMAGQLFTTRDAITLQAQGIDADAPHDLDAVDYAWSSDEAGPIGTGHTDVARGLEPGDHTITVDVTDRAGNVVTGSVPITIVEAAPIDPALEDAVAALLRGPIDPLSPIEGQTTPVAASSGGGCGFCVPLVIGLLTAALAGLLLWQRNALSRRLRPL